MSDNRKRPTKHFGTRPRIVKGAPVKSATSRTHSSSDRNESKEDRRVYRGSAFSENSTDSSRKPYTKKSDSSSYSDRKSSYDKSDRAPRTEGDSKPWERRESSGGQGSYNKDRKPYESRGGSNSYSDRKPSYDRTVRAPRAEGESKPWERRESSGGQGSYNKDRKPYASKGGSNSYSDRKPSYDRTDRAPRTEGDAKPWERRESSGGQGSYNKDRKPYESRGGSNSYSDRKSSYDKSDRAPRAEGDAKPWEHKEGGRSESTYSKDRKYDDRNSSSHSSSGKRNFTAQDFKSPKKDSYSRDEATPTKPMSIDDIWNMKDDDDYTPHVKEVEKDPNAPVRLNKFISNAGVCGRRDADDLISAGKITINGAIVTELGYKVNPKDTVLYNGKPLVSEKKVYVLLNKPKDTITTKSDPEGRKTVYDIIAGACTEQVEAVGRLDRNTTGVLLFTNDGDLAQRILHPKFNKMKIYHVHLDKALALDDYEKISQGVTLDDGFVDIHEIQYVGEEKNEVGIQIHSGRNHIVKRVFTQFGYNVEKLDRVYFAGLTKKNLPRGRWRLLTKQEVAILKQGAYE